MMLERMRRGDQERNQGQEQRRPATKEPEVHLVVNEQENSILANAPPDKLAVVRQAVQALDVPASESRRSDAVTRMKIYRTKSIDPDAMADLIQELVAMGKLQTNTQVQSDDESNTLIVYAVPADHLAIANLVSQVDEDGRDVRIIRCGNSTSTTRRKRSSCCCRVNRTGRDAVAVKAATRVSVSRPTSSAIACCSGPPTRSTPRSIRCWPSWVKISSERPGLAAAVRCAC